MSEYDEATSGANVSEKTRPRRQYKEDTKKRNKPAGRKRINPQSNATRMNWKSPFIWSQIENAAVLAGKPWSPHDITVQAKRLDPVIFLRLTEQVVGRWIDPDAKAQGVSQWRKSVLAEVMAGNSPGGKTTRIGILAGIPDLSSH